jgi:hypothetical protein
MDRNNRTPVSVEILNHIVRWSDLGHSPVEGKSGRWELSLVIPETVFLRNTIKTFDGLSVKGNFYKCGDKLKVPHFLSWNPIKSEKPNFHLSEFFGEVLFE